MTRLFRMQVLAAVAVPAFLGLHLWTRQPRTAPVLAEYLQGRGYSGIALQGPWQDGCRGRRLRFAFQAVASSGRPVSGEVCMGFYSSEHEVRESSRS
jgi:hypothetical protein